MSLTTTDASLDLTADHIEQYHDEGLLILEDVFSSAEVDRMQAEADRMLELTINTSLATDRQNGRLDVVEDDDGDQMIRKLQPVDDLSLTFSRLERALREPLAQLMEDEPRLMEEKLNYKAPLPEPVEWLEPARATSAFPVHNDWAYYQAQDYPQSVLSTAIMVDDNTKESGPLHVWPGSHDTHRDHQHVDGLGLQVPADQLDGKGHDVIAPAGSVIFFSSLLVHSSRPNSSGRPRRLMIYSHYPAGDGDHLTPDQRNGPTRLRESPYEWEYQRLKDAGEFEDRFTAPTYD